MRTVLGRQGFIKGFMYLALLVAVLFVIISFGKPYYRYNTLKSHTKDLLLMEIGTAERIKTQVMADAGELNIPLDEKNLEVTAGDHKIKVRATWSEVVDFWGYYQKKLDFVMETET